MRIYSLLLLLVLAAALLMIGSPTAAQVSPTATSTPGVIIVATAVPSATAMPRQANGCYVPLSLSLGSQVFLRGGVNIRSAPSESAPLVNYYPNPVVLRLDGGPVCADGYNWWQISGVGNPGWVIEGTPAQYFLQQAINPNTTNCAAPLDTVTVGDRLRTVTGSRIHRTPDNDSFVITVVQPGVSMDVIDGPRCYGGLNWWQVRAPYGNSGTTVDGWIAEGYPDGYYVEGLTSSGQPALACRAPLRLHVGTRAAVTYQDGVPRRLRAAPSASAPVVANLLDGIAFTVINGDSVCADGYNWWQVQIVSTGLTGWLAEGLPGNYWFDVLVN